MPNAVIDMGFMSNDQRAIINSLDGTYFGTATSSGWSTSEEGAQQIRPFISWMRDRIRTELEAENGGQNWRVSRIIEWEGTGGVGAHWGYGFKIEQLSGGSPTGKEWLLLFNGLRQGTAVITPSSINEVVGNVASYTSYFVGWNPTVDGFIGIQYNTGGLTTSWSLDASLGDTFDVGNDFNAPQFSPWTEDDQFFPDTGLHAQVRGQVLGAWDGSRMQDRWVFIYNHDIPYCGFYRAKDRSNVVREVVIAGDIIVPRVSTDTRPDGWFFYSIVPAAKSISQDGEGLYAINPDTGAEDAFQPPVFHESYTTVNQPRSDDTFDKDLVKVVNTNVDKGYLNPDLIAVQGPHEWMRNVLFDSPEGANVKLTDELVFPWTTTDPVFPAGYPSDWFGPRIQDSVP